MNKEHTEKGSLTDRGQKFVQWLKELRQITCDQTNCFPDEVKINEEEAFKYYKDGYTAYQCFREEY
jgi:hypothetical protein